MTCGMTVAPMIPTASRVASLPGRCGTKVPPSTSEPERGADELRKVGRHRDRLGLEPEEDHDRPREAVATDLGEVLPGRDSELRRERLDERSEERRVGKECR